MSAIGLGGLGQSGYYKQRASAAGLDGSSTVLATGSGLGSEALPSRIRLVGVSARRLLSSSACSRCIESNSSSSSSSSSSLPSFEYQVRVRVILIVMRSERNVRGQGASRQL